MRREAMQSGAAPYVDQKRPGGTFAALAARKQRAQTRTPGRQMAALKQSMGPRDPGLH